MNDIKTTDTTKEYKALVDKIAKRIEQGVAKAVTEVKKSQLETYWDNGRYIVEFEQQGKEHAEYGLNLLKSLAGDLTLRMGKGYSRPNLYNMRKFYQTYPNGYESVEKLTWSHICELIRIDDALERKICANLQEFLLELGKGFTFVKEQFPMNINNHIYKCDLVFYHRILKCFVLIDLKVNAVQYDDIGQMNMYM